jgi:hypothetical protein
MDKNSFITLSLGPMVINLFQCVYIKFDLMTVKVLFVTNIVVNYKKVFGLDSEDITYIFWTRPAHSLW